MKTTYALSGAALFAATTLAAPAAQNARLQRAPQPFIPAPAPAGIEPDSTNGTFIQYSENWSGVAWTSPPSGSTFKSVTGTFNLPPLSAPGSGTYGASAWVGIDGDSNTPALIQSGCEFDVQGSSKEYRCWTEWIPAAPVYFTGFTNLNEGDEIEVTVSLESATSATAVLKNKNTGGSASRTFHSPQAGATAVGKNAEWIVEDFSEGSGLVPFADFHTVTFTGCSATAGGQTVGLDGATTLDIVSANGQNVRTKVTREGNSGFEVTWKPA